MCGSGENDVIHQADIQFRAVLESEGGITDSDTFALDPGCLVGVNGL